MNRGALIDHITRSQRARGACPQDCHRQQLPDKCDALYKIDPISRAGKDIAQFFTARLIGILAGGYLVLASSDETDSSESALPLK